MRRVPGHRLVLLHRFAKRANSQQYSLHFWTIVELPSPSRTQSTWSQRARRGTMSARRTSGWQTLAYS